VRQDFNKFYRVVRQLQKYYCRRRGVTLLNVSINMLRVIHVANHDINWGMISFKDTRQDYGTSPMMHKNGDR
jgi:hypothetical protein